MSPTANASPVAKRASALTNITFIPTAAKYVLCLLLLLNWRSLPFMWHFRVFRPIISIRLKHLLLRLRTFGQSRAVKEEEDMKWLDAMSPIGVSPFDSIVTYKTWASIDDIDFNLHLSNSCYAKTLDAARFKAAVTWYPGFFRAGGWMALGATHYNFLREIPMLSNYEVRLSMAAWDNKWMFLVARYVTHIKSKAEPKSSPPTSTPDVPDMFSASLRMPSTAISGSSTPLPSSSTTKPSPSSEAIKTLLRANIHSGQEPDGATLHCIAISELCFKHGRITVPPSIALAVNGFSRGPENVPAFHVIPASPPMEQRDKTSDSGDTVITNSKTIPLSAPPPPRTHSSTPLPQTYSISNPPPHWEYIRPFRFDKRRLASFMRGGWKDVPKGQEWWIDALGGEVEERRVRNLEAVRGVKEGMVGARGIY